MINHHLSISLDIKVLIELICTADATLGVVAMIGAACLRQCLACAS